MGQVARELHNVRELLWLDRRWFGHVPSIAGLFPGKMAASRVRQSLLVALPAPLPGHFETLARLRHWGILELVKDCDVLG